MLISKKIKITFLVVISFFFLGIFSYLFYNDIIEKLNSLVEYNYTRNILYDYLGKTTVPICVFLLFYIYFVFIKRNKIKIHNEIRFYLSFILMYSIFFTFIVLFENISVIDDSNAVDFLNVCIYKYKIGYIATYILYSILKFNIKYILYIFIIVDFILIFLVVFNPIKEFIRLLFLDKQREEQVEMESEELKEKLKIKKVLMEKETIKLKKYQEAKERINQEKAEKLKKEKGEELLKIINLDEED